MGRFSGYLIVSDIDGTLYNSHHEVSEENRQALEYFKSEGGIFTLASGRTLPDVTQIDNRLQLCNAALLGSNGAVVGRGADVLWQCRFDKQLAEVVQRVLEHADYCDAEFVTPTVVSVFRPNYMTEVHKQYVSDRFEVINTLADIPETTAMVAFWMQEERILEFKELLARLGVGDYYDSFQGYTYAYEMVPKGMGKGAAALKLKELTQSHTLICAGDHFNDVTMLKAADISFAPRNALDGVKQTAKVQLKRGCDESIYPEVLEYLERQ